MSASEVARLRERIELDCQASWQALYGLASGCAQHEFISARFRRMESCHQSLSELLGDEQATTMVCDIFNRVGEAYEETNGAKATPLARQIDVRSPAQAVLRKIVLVQEDK